MKERPLLVRSAGSDDPGLASGGNASGLTPGERVRRMFSYTFDEAPTVVGTVLAARAGADPATWTWDSSPYSASTKLFYWFEERDI